MAIKSSGSLSINTDIVGEFGGSTPHAISEYVRGGSLVPDGPSANANIPTSTSNIQWSDFYGAVNETDLSQVLTPVVINGEDTAKQVTVSSYISSGGILTIPSSLWVWTDSTSTAALIIDIPCTIKNSGKIIGQGGDGAYGRGGVGQDGGPAIKINSGVSGVTIINNSGAYIAGGGGGGAGYEAGGFYAGGGGGAGGGRGAPGSSYDSTYVSGGIINAEGDDAGLSQGGGSGGEGGKALDSGPQANYRGGGGGRILPGVGGSGGSSGGNGGSAGSAGAAYNSESGSGGGGGGGWGAAGGTGYYGGTVSGGSGGAAISDSGVTYTLTDNGTIYGAT